MNGIRAGFVVGMVLTVVLAGVGLTSATPNELSGDWDVSDGFEDDVGNWTFATENTVTSGSFNHNSTQSPHEGNQHGLLNVTGGTSGFATMHTESDFTIVNSSTDKWAVQWWTKENSTIDSTVASEWELNDGSDEIRIRNESTGAWEVRGSLVTSYNIVDPDALNVTLGAKNDPYHKFVLKRYSDDTFEVYVDGGLAINGTISAGGFGTDPKFRATVDYRSNLNNQDWFLYLDNVAAVSNTTSLPGQFDISGTVSNEDGNAVSGATVTVNSSGVSDTTDSNGIYNLTLANGTHKITASHPDFETSSSINVTVNGSALTNQDISLVAGRGFRIETANFLEHNATAGYKVFLNAKDVTDSATVTSSNTTVITVNTTSFELEATGNNKVNQRVTITASYQGNTATQNVTVANKSLNNIGILPPSTWPAALLGSGGPGDTTGASSTWPGAIQLQWIFVALCIGATLSYVTGNSFISNAAILGVLAMGMFYGWVSNGLLIMSIVFVLYITSTRGMGGIDPNIGSKRG